MLQINRFCYHLLECGLPPRPTYKVFNRSLDDPLFHALQLSTLILLLIKSLDLTFTILRQSKLQFSLKITNTTAWITILPKNWRMINGGKQLRA